MSAAPAQSPSEPNPLKVHIETLEKAFVGRAPFCSGSIPVAPEDILLFYGKDKNARRLDFTDASEEDLRHLADTCDPASFGVDNEDVMDDSYRKAGKLDIAHFVTTLDPVKCGLVEVIRNQFLEGPQVKASIRVERYKLNVYGFFKGHKDTPRSESMFGSLVVVLPTDHVGGALVFRENDQEWTFDSAHAVARQPGETLRLGYAVFYSDVEHAVTPVQAGYRVTLTYNLYFEDPSPVQGSVVLHDATYDKLYSALQAVLNDSTFIPEGGLLGFALRREYPVRVGKADLGTIEQFLKGSDAALLRACKALSLNASFKALVRQHATDPFSVTPTYPVLCNRIPDVKRFPQEDWDDYVCRKFGGKRVAMNVEGIGSWVQPDIKIHWVLSPRQSLTTSKQQYMAFGNEPTLTYVYAHVCLIIDLGPVGARSGTNN
ncbi:unnamed protein product [Somion occarium]|uniref:Fe2OG dioxygenase domain-containing protein n=1 Tax=Somion occarium TaxID=3059160 RepID=A0ABP1D0C0_9APHY